MTGTAEKIGRAKKIISELGSVVVAFSGGADSALLLKICAEALGEKCVAVTIASETITAEEIEQARAIAASLNARHEVLQTSALADPIFAANPPDRCYHCKKAWLAKIRAFADEHGLKHIADGTNADDPAEHRPGLKAAREAGVRQPLREAGLTRRDIRETLQKTGAASWARPAQSCLATRIPTGTPITKEALKAVEDAERVLHENGFDECRVRRHGPVARIELPPEDIARFVKLDDEENLVEKIKDAGFRFVTLNLDDGGTGGPKE